MSAQVAYSGGEFSKSSTVRGAKRSSAEWIAEAPSGAAVLPLADFGTVLFGEDSTGITGTCEATMGGKTQPIGSFSTIEEITMENSNNVKEAIPSGLSSDGTSFSVTWAAQ